MNTEQGFRGPESGLLGGIEPVRLRVSGTQLLLEAGQDDCWLVSDLSSEEATHVSALLTQASEHADGLQFIAVQTSPGGKGWHDSLPVISNVHDCNQCFPQQTCSKGQLITATG